MKKQTIIDIAGTLLLVMFLYTAFSKYFDWGSYQRGMNSQHFPKELTALLIYSLPPIEIIAGTLLIFTRTKLAGFLISIVLMLAFTAYVGLIVAGYFTKVPCPCGGALKEITWAQHLIFNACFLAIAAIGGALQWSNDKTQRLSLRPR